MIPTVLAHAHPTLHIHPETVMIAAVSIALALMAWKVVRRGKAS